MKWLAILLILIPMMVSAEPLKIIPVEIYSSVGEGIIPIFTQEDWADITAYFECYGAGNLTMKSKLIDLHGKIVEKWVYNIGYFDCTSPQLIMTFDTFGPKREGLYTVKFEYIYNGIVKSHKTKIRWLDW